MVHPRRVTLGVLAALSASLLGADIGRETGAYLFHNYTAREYGGSPQNFGFTEDKRGILYVANADGVLESDGVSWRLTRLSNGSVVRSVGVGPAGRVYLGGQEEFGFLKPD